MDDQNKVIWLASYPKSGNTWFRAFLTALLNPSETSPDINSLYDTTIASSRLLFDEYTGIASSDLTSEEIDRIRPLVYRMNATESTDLVYHKTHDAWQVLDDGSLLFPPEITKGVVYFIRNPLDVAVSFASHLNTGIDKTIRIMNDPGYGFCERPGRLHSQLRQKLSTWSGHVKSWVDDSGLPVLVMRYEDMKQKPLETFSKAVGFIGLDYTPDRINKALELSSFELLRKQEEEKGFGEKSPGSASFFRKGTIDDWKNVLTGNQVKQVTDSHRTVMKRFGYLQ